MTDVQADNITMSGGGLYSLATVGAKHVIDHTLPRVINALDAIVAAGSAPQSPAYWNFSDMGCADGGTSLDLWRKVATHIRNQSTADIQIVYADQARNDFNALVQILHGLTDFDTYLNEFDNLRLLQSGASFYTPALPADSLHLGFSATAMHWLSAKPGDISDHVHMVGASGKELERFTAQAQQDWTTILVHRARELKSGGKLVFANFCKDEQGRYLGATDGINMFDTFNSIWQRFVDDGVVTADEYRAMTLPQYYNTPQEFAQPFEQTNSEVSKAGLRLDSIETKLVRCPFAEDFKTHGDAKKFALEYIPTIRTWNESIFHAGLSAARPAEERREIIENYYSTYQKMVEDNPAGHAMDYVHAYMTIGKD